MTRLSNRWCATTLRIGLVLKSPVPTAPCARPCSSGLPWWSGRNARRGRWSLIRSARPWIGSAKAMG